jgi:hypothetical protein
MCTRPIFPVPKRPKSLQPDRRLQLAIPDAGTTGHPDPLLHGGAPERTPHMSRDARVDVSQLDF